MRQFFSLLIISLVTVVPLLCQDLTSNVILKLKEIDSLVASQELDQAKATIYQLKETIAGSEFASLDSIQLFLTSKLAFINFNQGNCDSLSVQGNREILLRTQVHGPGDSQTISAMHNMGVYYINCDSTLEAKKVLVQTLKLHREHLNTIDQLLLVTLDDLAYAYGLTDDVDSAGIHYKELISLLTQYSSKNDFYFHVIDNYSALLINAERFGDASGFYEELKTHFEGSEDYVQFLKDYYNVFIHIPDYAKGWETGSLLLATCENQPELCGDISVADFQLNVARLGAVLSKNSEALNMYAKAEPQFSGQPEVLVDILLETAQIAALINRKNLQLRKLNEAINVLRENSLTDHQNYSKAVFELGTLYTYMGKSREADELYSSYIEEIEKNGASDPKKIAEAYQALGNQRYLLQNFKDADFYFLKAKDILLQEGVSNTMEFASVLNSLGALNEALAGYDKARQYYAQALSIVNKQSDGSKVNLLTIALSSNLANILMEVSPKNDSISILLDKAIALQQTTTGVRHPAYANLLGNRGLFHQDNDRFDEAEKDYLKSLEILKSTVSEEHPEYLTNTSNLGLLYDLMDRNEEALQYLTTAKNLYEKYYTTSHPGYLLAINNLANLYTQMSDFDKAEPLMLQLADKQVEQINQSFTYLSENEKADFVGEKRKFLENFKRFAIGVTDQGRNVGKSEVLKKWYELELITKGILLNSTKKVRNQIFESGDQELIDLFSEWTVARKQIAELQSLKNDQSNASSSTIDSLNNVVINLEKELGRKSSNFTSSFGADPISFEDVRDRLLDDEVAIEIVKVKLDDRSIYTALMVSKDLDQPQLIILGEDEMLEQKVFKLYQNSIKFTSDGDSSFDEFWNLLFDNFWRPIHTELIRRQISNVYYAPDGIYHKISLNTLYDTKAKKSLLDHYNIIQLSSSKDLLNRDENVSQAGIKDQRMLLVGRPKYLLGGEDTRIEVSTTRSFNMANITDLPGTEDEIISICSLLKGKGIAYEQMLNEESSEQNVKKDLNYDVIHIATHGFFLENSGNNADYRDPMLYSGIVLAGASNKVSDNESGEDGILTAYEIMNLEFSKNDLVILSACETGLGAISEGEGIYGLQRAFFVAGTNTIVMSLWKVDDEATRDLMTNFYKSYLKSGDKREAFREAQRKIKKKYKAPLYWGAFVMIGI